MLFFYPRLGLNSDIDPGFSFGLGARHYLSEWDAIVGANVFYDRYASTRGNYYDQLGVGLEVLSRWVDARFNYYLPESDPHVIDSRSVTSRSRARSVSYGRPFATGYSIRQPVTTTTTTTTLSQLFERFEDSMEGYDAEVGFLTPWLDQYVALRWFIGYYGFNNSYGNDLEGVKARAELRLSSKLALDATYYDDDEVTGDHWLYGIRMNIPVFPENLAEGRSPFHGSFRDLFSGVRLAGADSRSRNITIPNHVSTLTAHTPARPLEHIVAGSANHFVRDRMTEEILRRSFVQTAESDFIENLSARDFDRNVVRDTRIAIIDPSVVFVNNTRGTPAGAGTYESPLSLVQDGVNRASTLFGNAGDVFVTGTGTNYTEDVSDAGSSVRIWGSATGYPARGGRRFAEGMRPVLDGGIIIDSVPQFSLSGFEIVNGIGGTGDGVNVSNVSDITITHNEITTGSDGINLSNTGISSQFNVTNNLLTGNSDDGLDIQIDADTGPGITAMGTIADNQFLGNGGRGLSVNVQAGETSSVVNLAVTNNLASDNAQGGGFFDLSAPGISSDTIAPTDSRVSATFSGNQFLSNTGPGLELAIDTDNGGLVTVNAHANQFNENSAEGLLVVQDSDDGNFTGTFTDNQFLSNGSAGASLDMELDGEGLQFQNVTFRNNLFSTNRGSGLEIFIGDSDSEINNRYVLVGNRFLSNGQGGTGDGIHIEIDLDSIDRSPINEYHIANNLISDNADDGLFLQITAEADDDAPHTVVISGNQFLSNGGDSIELEIDGDSTTTLQSTLNNVSQGPGGFDLRDSGTPEADGSILINGTEIFFPSPGNVP